MTTRGANARGRTPASGAAAAPAGRSAHWSLIAPPASNLAGQVAGGAWTFALPSLELGTVVCLGEVSPAELATLARLARRVVVVGHRPGSAARGRPAGPIVVPSLEAAALAAGTVDVVRLGREPGPSVAAADPDRVRALLAPGGRVYLETVRRRREEAADPRLDALRGAGLVVARELWLDPLSGEPREAVPAGDAEARAYAIRTRFAGTMRRARIVGRAAELARTDGARRTALLLRRPDEPASDDPGPPAYLRAVMGGAEESAPERWCLLARGRYNSQKVLVVGFPATGSEPTVVVKLPREPSLDARLQNEERALRALEPVAVAAGRVPRVVGAARHAGLAMLAETFLPGRPFRDLGGGARRRAAVGDAVAFLRELGRETALPGHPVGLAAELGGIVERFGAIYRPAPEQATALHGLVAQVAAHPGPVPRVFQHGDPGVWNLFVTGDRSIAFLDWEAGERHGMPLWDLLYLLRSYVVSAGRLGGLRSRTDAFARTFIGRSGESRFVLDAIHDYRRVLDLPAGLIYPLIVTCWAHRAVKEASRLSPERLDEGHYVGLVRLCLEAEGETIAELGRPIGGLVGPRPALDPRPAR